MSPYTSPRRMDHGSVSIAAWVRTHRLLGTHAFPPVIRVAVSGMHAVFVRKWRSS